MYIPSSNTSASSPYSHCTHSMIYSFSKRATLDLMYISDATDQQTPNTNGECKVTDDHDGMQKSENRAQRLQVPVESACFFFMQLINVSLLWGKCTLSQMLDEDEWYWNIQAESQRIWLPVNFSNNAAFFLGVGLWFSSHIDTLI